MRTNCLRSFALLGIAVLLVMLAVPALASDQQKADKRLRQISAMAIDSMSRSIVNQTMADAVHAQRIELMRQRRAMNLSYGSLFVAHQLAAGGVKMLDIALELETGKDISQIANEKNANWKLIGDAAKKLNDRIEDNIYRHFLHVKADLQVAATDKYDPHTDLVRADLDVTPDELASARSNYEVWKNRGSAPNANRLDAAAEREAAGTAEIYKGGERPHPVP